VILPLYNSLAPLTINRLAVAAGPALDPDAQAYIDAVELEDGQALEDGVRTAINDFVVGCKDDGIWSAIKSACILAGARTLDGALTPLVGSAPTNNNFVSGDYDRETGLVGNQSTKYLDSNQSGDTASDSINSFHLTINATTVEASSNLAYGGVRDASNSPPSDSEILTNILFINRGALSATFSRSAGFHGSSRNGTSVDFRSAGSVQTITNSPRIPSSLDIFFFARNLNGTANLFCNPRISFYSIGGSIDLADLDSRVSTLMTDIAAAIP